MFASLFFLYGRELTPLDAVIRAQQATSTVLYQLAYDDNNVAYKIDATLARNPTILVIGTSHAIQFRSEFFTNLGTFYNAGSLHNIADEIHLVSALPQNAKLKLILFVADPSFLTTEALPTTGYEDVTRYDLVLNFLKNGWREVYLDYFKGKFTLSGLIRKSGESSAIGIAALLQDTGHRNDGSHQPIKVSDAERLAALHEDIAALLKDVASDHNGSPPSIVPSHVKELEQFLALCYGRGISVVGFVPPLAEENYNALLATDNSYTETTRASYKIFSSTFAEYKYPFYDTSNVLTFGSSDQELLDGGHASEKMDVRILLYLVERTPALRPYLDQNHLQKLLKTSSETEVL